MNLTQVLDMKLERGTPIEIERDQGTELVYYFDAKINTQLNQPQLYFRREEQGDVFGFLLPYIKNIKRIGGKGE